MSDQSKAGSHQCTVHNCDEDATRRLEWPEPGGLRAEFCDDHAQQKLSITNVTEVEKL